MTFLYTKDKIKKHVDSKKTFNKIQQNIYIVIILSIYFLLRISGLFWGMPAMLHNDESVTVRSSLGMRFGDLNPHHFDWPSLYFYINYFVFYIFIKLRTQLQLIFGTETVKELLPFWCGPDLPFYILGRLLSTILVRVQL